MRRHRAVDDLVVTQIELPLPVATTATLRWFMSRGMPYEVCGVIHKNNLVTQYDNTFPGDRKHAFDMEVDLTDDHLLAMWHSHPTGPNHLSVDDIEAMYQLATHGFCFPWVVVSPESITSWQL